MAVMSPAEMAALRNEILTAVRPQMTVAPSMTPAEIAVALRPVMSGQQQAMASLTPFLTGAPGSSPLTDAAIEAFKVKTLPIIGNQMTLRGLGHSPAVAQVAGETLAMALPEFINADLRNRLNAAQLVGELGSGATTQGANLYRSTADVGQNAATLASSITGREAELGLSGARLSADIANAEAMRGLEAYRTAGQLQLGLTDSAARAAQIQQEQQRLALQAGQAGGGLQRDIAQGVADAVQAERLRLQGLSEGGTFGVFGSVVPTSIGQTSTTRSSSSSK